MESPDEQTAYGISSFDSNAMKSDNPHSGIYKADVSFQERGVFAAGFSFGQSEKSRSLGYQEEVSPTLRGGEGGNQKPVVLVDAYVPDVARTLTNRADGSFCADRGPNVVAVDVYNQTIEGEIAPTVTAAVGGTNTSGLKVFDARGNGDWKTVPTITCDNESRVTDYIALVVGNGQLNQMSMAEQANTLDTMHDQQAVIVFDKEMYNSGKAMRGEMQARFDNVAPTCRADSHPSGVLQNVVRRLTPLECERLQGYPDGWTDIGEWTDSKGKKHKPADSPRYKALGNSIALPFWAWLARRICAQYERPATMASLFDGIGGFPLSFQRCGAIPVWASEIEEFPMAVTKLRFPE